jgi:hypothetical protein
MLSLQDEKVGTERAYRDARDVHVQTIDEFADFSGRLNRMDYTLRGLLSRRTR